MKYKDDFTIGKDGVPICKAGRKMNHDGSEKSDDVNNPKAFYKRTYYKSRTFNKRMYLWPVPQAQMDINPNLRQAPGY